MTGADEPGGGSSAPPGRRKTSSAAEFAGIGFQFAGAILLFLFAGQWLDRRLGTAPLFLIVGVFLGASAAFYGMYRRLMAAQRRDAEERKRQ